MTDEGTYIVISTEPVLKVRWLGLNIEPNGITIGAGAVKRYECSALATNCVLVVCNF